MTSRQPMVGDLPALPHTWRPRFGPLVAIGMAVLLVAAGLGMWIGLPRDVRAAFNWLETLTLTLVLAAVVGGLYRLAGMRVRADEHGLTVVNLVRTRRLEWAQVLKVNLRPGDPWVQLDIDDGTTVSVMAIQTADGKRAKAAARELSRMVLARTRTHRDD